MDQFPPSAVVGAAPMRTLGPGASQLLLCAATGVGAEPALLEDVGRGVHAASLLRSAQDDGVDAATRPWGGSQAGAAFAAGDGIDGGLCQAAFEPKSPVSQAFSVFVEGCDHRAAQPGLEHRHHTYIRLRGGFVYLAAVLDWYSRYVLAWELSISLVNVSVPTICSFS
jgi:hypothetical protein